MTGLSLEKVWIFFFYFIFSPLSQPAAHSSLIVEQKGRTKQKPKGLIFYGSLTEGIKSLQHCIRPNSVNTEAVVCHLILDAGRVWDIIICPFW